MNADPLLGAWIDALGWTLVHSIWQGALVAAAYALLRGLLRNADARLRYACGLLALSVLLLLPTLTLWQLAPGTGVAMDAPAVAAADPAWASRIDALLPAVVLFWLAGVLAFAAREALRWHAVRTLLLGSASALPEWTARAARIAQRMQVARRVRVAVSTLAITPSLIGWLAPVIVLPASSLLALAPRQLEMVIAHELAHVRRADYLVNLLQVVVETLLFHHPAVHWISREVRELREVCCDDLVLRSGVDPLHYADTLASLETLRGLTHAPALAATGGSLLLRVRRIVGVDEQQPGRVDGQAVVWCVALLALALLVGGQQRGVESTALASPQHAGELLARSAAASIGAAIEATAGTPSAPDRAPAAPLQSITLARPPVLQAAAGGTIPEPVQGAVPTATTATANRITLEIALAQVQPAPIAVNDIRGARRNIRPLFVFVDGSPLDCARATGSRICRPLRGADVMLATAGAR